MGVLGFHQTASIKSIVAQAPAPDAENHVRVGGVGNCNSDAGRVSEADSATNRESIAILLPAPMVA